MDLLSVVLLCGPLVHPATTLSVIAVESGGHPYALHDNTDGRTYEPASAAEAAGLARALLDAGHRIDIGLMQINYNVWLKPTGFALARAFDACTNIRLGTTILSAHYAQALGTSATPFEALARALSRYNSGSESRALGYADQVLAVGAAPRSRRHAAAAAPGGVR